MNLPNISELPDTAFYGRVSTTKQDASIQTQHERAVEYANKRGLIMPEVLRFTDPDTSGSKSIFLRKGGAALLSALHQYPTCHNLIVTHPDRIGRDTRDGLDFYEWCSKHHISIHLIDFGGDALRFDTALGELQITMLFAVSKWFLNNLRANVKYALRHRRSKGWLVGTVPYGWRRTELGLKTDPNTGETRMRYGLEPYPEELYWIRHIHERRTLLGWSYKRIATELNVLGVPTKIPAGTLITNRLTKQLQPSTGRWQQGSIQNILTCSYSKAWLAGPMTEVAHQPRRDEPQAQAA